MLNCAHVDRQAKGVASSRPSVARYAIYYTPQPGTALAAFGRSWFGRANDGVTLQAFSDAGLSGTGFAKLAVAPGRYLVLRPVEATPSLDWLAAQCVASFEDFAAPPSETERAEHASPALNDYQRLLLESFGDPYVLSEYRFSITLTGPLDAAHLERVAQALWPVLEEICASGVTVDGLSLFGESGGRSPMRLLGRYKLGAQG